MGKSSAKQTARLVSGYPAGMTLCSGCCDPDPKLDGSGMSKCCHEVVLTREAFLDAIRGKIPKIPLAPLPDNPTAKKRTNKVRDAASGIRKGTKKFAAYELWKKGKSIAQIFEALTKQKMKPNMSSVRSWVGRFQHRYGDK